MEVDVPASSSTIVFRNTSLAPSDDLPDWPAEPVTVLSRFSDDGFETLHQYDFFPNPMAMLSDSGSAEEKTSEAAVDRIPCIFPSRPTDVVSVAPSCCDLRVGPSGKGFWTETRNVTMRHSRTPARCLVGFTVRRGPPEEQPAGLKERGASQRTGELQLCKDSLYSRRCNIHEILWKKYIVVSTAFEDTVGRIAIGDVTGRVEVLDLACDGGDC